MKDSEYCFAHNPETKDALHEAAVKGGNTPKKNYLELPPISVNSVRDVVKLLEETLNEVRSGKMLVNTANCIGYLSNIAIRALEASDLEKRVEAIEASLINEHRG